MSLVLNSRLQNQSRSNESWLHRNNLNRSDLQERKYFRYIVRTFLLRVHTAEAIISWDWFLFAYASFFFWSSEDSWGNAGQGNSWSINMSASIWWQNLPYQSCQCWSNGLKYRPIGILNPSVGSTLQSWCDYSGFPSH